MSTDRNEKTPRDSSPALKGGASSLGLVNSSCRRWISVLVTILVMLSLAVLSPGQVSAPASMAVNRVVRVIDGDTVVLRRGGHDVTCRLYAVDTPETVWPGRPVEPGGLEATAYVRGWLQGKLVRVSYDGPAASRDRYGRTLVYLWADRGREQVNYKLIELGMGRFDRRFKTRYREDFDRAEAKAKVAERGIWRKTARTERK